MQLHAAPAPRPRRARCCSQLFASWPELSRFLASLSSSVPAPHQIQPQAVVEAIKQAKRPALYIGGGCVDSGACSSSRGQGGAGRGAEAAVWQWDSSGQQQGGKGACRVIGAACWTSRCLAVRADALLPIPACCAELTQSCQCMSSPPAAPEVKEFVEHTGIPVAQTLMALGSFPEQDPMALQVGMMHGAVVCCRGFVPKCLWGWIAYLAGPAGAAGGDEGAVCLARCLFALHACLAPWAASLEQACWRDQHLIGCSFATAPPMHRCWACTAL